MKLQDQVISLELARKLKKLGVKQESLFYWADTRIEGLATGKDKHLELVYLDKRCYYYKYSAFTVAELGEMLPNYYASHKEEVEKGYSNEGDNLYRCFGGKETVKSFQAETEANARAKMLIYLLENKLLTL